jgi:hypothetical protein
MCQMCDEYEAELARMGIIEKIIVSDSAMATLQEDARRHGRTVEQEAASRLETASQRLSRAEILARLDRTAAMTPKDVKQTDSTILVREDRDR